MCDTLVYAKPYVSGGGVCVQQDGEELRLGDAACAYSAGLSDFMRNVFIQPNPLTDVSPSESLLTSLSGYGRLKRKTIIVCYQSLLSQHRLYPASCIFHPPLFARLRDPSVSPTRIIVLLHLFSSFYVCMCEKCNTHAEVRRKTA